MAAGLDQIYGDTQVLPSAKGCNLGVYFEGVVGLSPVQCSWQERPGLSGEVGVAGDSRGSHASPLEREAVACVVGRFVVRP
jgi:hypothetical protein